MSNLYEALKSIGDVWDNNRMLVADSVHCADGSSNATNSKQLGKFFFFIIELFPCFRVDK